MNHTKDCTARQAARQAWLAQWPNHCTGCEGRGGHTFWESHGLPGPGEQMWDICSCLENGKCPRCGRQLQVDEKEDYKACACGWWHLMPDAAPGAECLCAEPEIVEPMLGGLAYGTRPE